LTRVNETRRLFDPVGHYNRPDVFQLTVDTRPRRAVTLISEEPSATTDALQLLVSRHKAEGRTLPSDMSGDRISEMSADDQRV
jgi:hypothetical protein